MRLLVPRRFLLLFFVYFSSILSPVFSGSQSDSVGDFDEGGDDQDGVGFDIFGIPILFPYADYHKGRKLIQLRPKLPPFAINNELFIESVAHQNIPLGQGQLDPKNNNNFSPPLEPEPEINSLAENQAVTEPERDKYNREKILLDHGSCDNPFLIQDHGILNLGILAGVSFTDTQSYFVQYNALAKLFYTDGGWSERMAPNHDQAKDLKKLKIPTKSKHFDSWDNGDEIRLNGAMSVALYAGVSVIIADARAGAILNGNWAKDIIKLDENQVRIAFTREGGGGGTIRIQPMPLTKIEGILVKNWEGTLVYTFDRSTKEGRKALKHALNNRIFVKEEVDEDNVTLLTRRTSDRKKLSRNLQTGIPFIVRARASWHRVKMSQEIKNERNDDKTKIASKGYMKQKVYRHINLPKTNKHKKWKHFTYTNFHFNKISEGTSKIVKDGATHETKRSHIKLAMELSFTHDKVKVKKVNEYNKKIAKTVGINDFVIDMDYKKKKQIGYAGLTYRLNVTTDPLENIIAQAVENKHLFDEMALYLINSYFSDKNDPHSICRGKLTNRRLCIELVKLNTKRKLNKISTDLRKLNKEKYRKSRLASSTLLAKIARRLRTNQFVLQSFIALLPENSKGYGTFEIEGERFIGKKFIVDPSNQREIFDDIYDPDNDLLFDRIDAELRDENF